KNLKIPLPTILIPSTGPVNDTAASLPRKSNAKLLKVKKGVTTARNLFLLDYLKDHPNYKVTKGQFTAVWKACDTATQTKYKDLSKSHTNKYKKAPLVTLSTSKTAGASAACSGNKRQVG
ncbi:hypothetical protein C0991_003003, partial [Blastosporella zonata]